jgi:hypothetical protein
MDERPASGFLYEYCDVPQGESLREWRTRKTSSPQRRAHVATGMFAALFGRFAAADAARAARSR